MDRVQIYLATGQRARLSAAARKQGRPMAELVREALDVYLASSGSISPEGDTLFALAGAAVAPPPESGVSADIDRALAEIHPIGNAPTANGGGKT